MFDPRSILDAIVKGAAEPQAGSPSRSRDDALGSIGDLLKQIAGGDDAPAAPGSGRSAPRQPPQSAQPPAETDEPATAGSESEEEPPPSRARPRRPKREDAESDSEPAAAGSGGGLEDIIRDVLGGKGGGGLKDILDKVNEKGGLGEVLGPVLGQIFGQKAGGARVADVPEGAAAAGPGSEALADRIKALAGGRSPEEMMAAVKELIANNQFGAGMAAGGLGALVLGTRTGRSLAASAAKLGGLAVIGGLAYKAYSNYQQGAAAAPESLSHQRLVAPPSGSGFEAETVSQDLATTMLKAMVAAASADGRIDPAEHAKLVAGFGGESMPQAARDFLAREIAAPATIEAIAAGVTSEEAAVQVFTAARITVDPDQGAEHAFLAELADALGLDAGLVAHIDAAARGGA